MQHKTVDKTFLGIVVALVSVGLFIFFSASLGLLAREDIKFSAVAITQVISLLIGFVVLFVATKIPYKFWQKYAFYIFIASIVLTLFVFIPGLGFEHAGAKRWILLGPISFQPAETLKLAFIIYFATWIASVQKKIATIKFGLVPLTVLLGLTGGILLLQPDMGTFLVIATVGFAMFITAGGKWRHIFSLAGLGAIAVLTLGFLKPYIRARLLTFLDPAADPLGAGYQTQQSLIAIGSGKWFGRGLGQSVQKFNFLPEPIGDSIFAVFAEEWGFIGSTILIGLFVALALYGLRIAGKAPTVFSRTLVTGIIVMITAQSFINIASMLGVFPLTGMPLLFVSQGGSALILSLAAIGMVLHISKHMRL
jgi:cell division protein FtsW